LLVSFPPFHRCQYIRISLISPPSVSQKMAPRASTHSPVRFRRKTHLNSVENQGPAPKISPEEKTISDWLKGTSRHQRRMASTPRTGWENGVSMKTAFGAKTVTSRSMFALAHPFPKVSISDRPSSRVSRACSGAAVWGSSSVDMPLNIQRFRAPRAASGAALLLATALAGRLVAQQGEGDEAWDQGRADDARAAYERVLATDSTAFLANLRLGILLARRGKTDSALALVARARRSQPTDTEARLAEARTLAWDRRFDAAIARYDSVLAMEPRNPDALVGLGYVYHWKGRERTAERYARDALAADSAHQGARELREAVRLTTRPTTGLSANWTNDSDDNTGFRQSLDASAPLAPGVRVIAGVGALEVSDPVRDAAHVGGEAGLSWTIGGLQIAGAAGARRLSPNTAAPRTAGTYRGRAIWRAGPRLGVGAGYARHPFDEIASLMERGIDIESLEAGFDAAPARGLSVYGAGGGTWLSDGNHRTDAGAGVTQTVRGGVFVGAYGRTLGYERRGLGYFSPDRFRLLEGQAGYALASGPWEGRLSGGLGAQQIGRDGASQSEWHLDLRLGRRWGTGNRFDLFGTVTNSAASSTSGAYRYRTAGISLTIGL